MSVIVDQYFWRLEECFGFIKSFLLICLPSPGVFFSKGYRGGLVLWISSAWTSHNSLWVPRMPWALSRDYCITSCVVYRNISFKHHPQIVARQTRAINATLKSSAWLNHAVPKAHLTHTCDVEFVIALSYACNSFNVTYISHNWDKTWCTNIIILNKMY